MKVRALQNDTVDQLCWRHYGKTAGVTEKVLEANPGLSNQIFERRAGDRNARDNQRGGAGNRPVMGMTLDRINEYFAFATSALVTGVGVMTVSEKLALAGLLLGIVSAVRLAIHRRRIEKASQRRNDLIEQILRQAETRNLSDRERQLLEQLHGDNPA